MKKFFETGLGRTRNPSSRNSLPDPTEVLPFGRYGAGLYTEHPVGLLVVAAMLTVVLWRIPEARWFFAGSLLLGIVFGLCLWLYRR